jgi:hypothetical protein
MMAMPPQPLEMTLASDDQPYDAVQVEASVLPPPPSAAPVGAPPASGSAAIAYGPPAPTGFIGQALPPVALELATTSGSESATAEVMEPVLVAGATMPLADTVPSMAVLPAPVAASVMPPVAVAASGGAAAGPPFVAILAVLTGLGLWAISFLRLRRR